MTPEVAQDHAAVVAWRSAPKRWGHPLHSLCSYMAMFPPSVPHVFTQWLTEPGDVVYDPFSGRGTTALEACSMGRIGMASDLNPMANVLTAAKVTPPTWESLESRLAELEATIEALPIENEPEAIRGIFAPGTLGQLLWLRENLDRASRDDTFILATLLGILHLNADSNGVPKGLTVSMPNTFAMAPGYVLNYVQEHKLVAPEVDVLQVLRLRLERYRLHLDLAHDGLAWSQDASVHGEMEAQGLKAKLVFSSPPYLHVMKYGKFNWIRLWLLGESPKEVDSNLFTTASLPRYLDFMSTVLQRLGNVVQDDGFVCLVIGDVVAGEKTICLAERVSDSCIPDSLTLIDTIVDQLPAGRKVSRIWGKSRGMATKTDRVLVLGGRDTHGLPALPDYTWQS